MLFGGDKIIFEREASSYRDPLGHIIYADGRVIRRLSPEGARLWNSFFSSTLYKKLSERNLIVETKQLNDNQFIDSDFPVALEHAKIPFVSYPYEWTFDMLKDAALFTLEILLESLKHKFTLRDGSSFNIQFHGGKPIFIDILSFAPYRKGQIWIGYSQFCQMFLFPLMIASHKKVDCHPWLRGNLEGISLDEMVGIFSFLDFYKKGVFFQVIVQHLLDKKKNRTKGVIYSSKMNEKKLSLVIRQLGNLTRSLKNPFLKTTWSDYPSFHSYDTEKKTVKSEFIKKICSARKRSLVWDIGANTGEYSRIASNNADLVVAIDSDHGALSKLYQSVRKEKIKNILPLLIDIVNPSPCCGWLNTETKTLWERGKPELVLALALIHHLCIARNIGLSSFIDWITELSTEGVVEFVTKEDPKVQLLLATREDIFVEYTKTNFESLLARKTNIKEVMELNQGKRYLYHFILK